MDFVIKAWKEPRVYLGQNYVNVYMQLFHVLIPLSLYIFLLLIDIVRRELG